MNGTRYRSPTEIINEILGVAASSDDNKNNSISSDGTINTNVIHNVVCSHTQLKKYLAIVTQSNLLHFDQEKQTFKITEKGRMFLNLYGQIREAIKGEA
jgi:predicted transcriptional regulator